MSYELWIYFPHPEFPLQRWQTLLDSFGAREVPEESDATYRNWLAHGEGDGVFIGLGPVDPKNNRYECCTLDTRWKVSVDSNSGGPPATRYAKYALPMFALMEFSDCTVHDCQRHVMRQTANFHELDAFLEVYGEFVDNSPRTVFGTQFRSELAEARSGDYELLVIDVRSQAEYADWHIPGSRNIPFHELAGDAAQLRTVPVQDEIYLVSGRFDPRAEQAAGLLSEGLRRPVIARLDLDEFRQEGFSLIINEPEGKA